MRGRLFVRGDMAETMRRIAAAEPLFRLSVAFDLVHFIGVVVLLASGLKLVYAVTGVLMALGYLTIVRLTTDKAYQQALQPEALQALVRLNSSATAQQYYVGLAIWALSSRLLARREPLVVRHALRAVRYHAEFLAPVQEIARSRIDTEEL